MNWNDIKIFLELARSERLSVAAKRLLMDASTVSRRLHKLEEQLDTKLFERTIDGHTLTLEGTKLLSHASKMEQAANIAFEDIQSSNEDNCGRVRIGITEAFGSFFIAQHLVPLQQAFPKISIDLLHFSRFVKISRNEADIAIAVERPKGTSMIVTKLCDYKLQLYADKKYLAQTSIALTLEHITQHKWVSYIDNLLFTEQLSYLKELSSRLAAPLEPNFSSTSIISQFNAIKSGLGIGILPCFLADQDKGLVKILTKEVDIVRTFWLVTHPESKRLSHVETVWEYLKQSVKEHEYQLMPPNID